MAHSYSCDRTHCSTCNYRNGTTDITDEELETAERRIQLKAEAVHRDVEQLLFMLRTANSQQLESLFAAIRSDLPRQELFTMVREYVEQSI